MNRRLRPNLVGQKAIVLVYVLAAVEAYQRLRLYAGYNVALAEPPFDSDLDRSTR